MKRPATRAATSLAAAAAAVLAAAASAAPDRFILRAAEAENEGASFGIARLYPWSIGADAASVRVTADGAEARSWIVSQGEGEPLDVVFECPQGAGEIVAEVSRAGENGAPLFPPLDPPCGLFLETREFPAGLAEVDSLDAARAAWESSPRVFGRSAAPQIFAGIHPHGPTGALLARFEGVFNAPEQGEYAFAVLSDDASFLLVDGAPVAEWPGWHGNDWSGIHGEHSGTVALGAGLHRIELMNCQKDWGFSVAAAWRKPGDANFAIMPEDAFPRPRRHEIARVEGERARTAFSWEMAEHVIAQGHALVKVRFHAFAQERAKCAWRFGDGASAEGRDAEHVFSAAGLARIELAADDGAPAVRSISVHPQWTQRHDGPDDVYARLRGSVLAAGLNSLDPPALARLVRLALVTDDEPWLVELARACHARVADFAAADADALFSLGLFVQRPCMREYGLVPDFWGAALAMTPPPDAATLALVRLHLASFLIHSGGSLDEASRLLAAIDEGDLSESDARLRMILSADIHATRGERDAAEAIYRRAGGVVDPDDTAYQVRRIARLENARVFLAQGDFDSAERVAREIEWERPLERLGLETGLVMVSAWRGRGETPFALAGCRRLLAAVPDDPRRPALLLASAEVFDGAGLAAERDAALAELSRNYPYSEEAAIAGDRFPAP